MNDWALNKAPARPLLVMAPSNRSGTTPVQLRKSASDRTRPGRPRKHKRCQPYHYWIRWYGRDLVQLITNMAMGCAVSAVTIASSVTGHASPLPCRPFSAVPPRMMSARSASRNINAAGLAPHRLGMRNNRHKDVHSQSQPSKPGSFMLRYSSLYLSSIPCSETLKGSVNGGILSTMGGTISVLIGIRACWNRSAM
jgi:hypothetical protein